VTQNLSLSVNTFTFTGVVPCVANREAVVPALASMHQQIRGLMMHATCVCLFVASGSDMPCDRRYGGETSLVVLRHCGDGRWDRSHRGDDGLVFVCARLLPSCFSGISLQRSFTQCNNIDTYCYRLVEVSIVLYTKCGKLFLSGLLRPSSGPPQRRVAFGRRLTIPILPSPPRVATRSVILRTVLLSLRSR
jgi:hypothetical protein